MPLAYEQGRGMVLMWNSRTHTAGIQFTYLRSSGTTNR